MKPEFRIVHSIASLAVDHGGPSNSATSLASGQLLHTDGSVHIVFRRQAGRSVVAPSARVEMHETTAMPAIAPLATWSVLRRLCRAQRVILHDHGIWHSHNVAVGSFALATRTPLVISPRGMLEPWAVSYRRRAKAIARAVFQDRFLRRAACLMATSTQELEHIRKLGFRNPIALVPNGVNASIPSLARSSARSPRTALFLSRIHPKKGLVHAIEAWSRLRPADWKLRIVGPGEIGHRQELEALVSEYGLEDQISFEGLVDGVEKWQCYYDADLFLLPTYSENFGLVIAEALACGLPVVTTVGTPWRPVVEKRCGWIVDTGTAPLAEALASILPLPSEELRAMGQRGREWVRSEFSWSSIAARSVEVYRWLLGGGDPPGFVDRQASAAGGTRR